MRYREALLSFLGLSTKKEKPSTKIGITAEEAGNNYLLAEKIEPKSSYIDVCNSVMLDWVLALIDRDSKAGFKFTGFSCYPDRFKSPEVHPTSLRVNGIEPPLKFEYNFLEKELTERGFGVTRMEDSVTITWNHHCKEKE